MVHKVINLPLLVITYIPISFSSKIIETWMDQMKILCYDVDLQQCFLTYEHFLKGNINTMASPVKGLPPRLMTYIESLGTTR